ncbi:hypothetical protein TNCV_1322061 [Trichonephila clavipes]|nr:hypothetical protein TNCV_1322061 [Trichonephila clavipes]
MATRKSQSRQTFVPEKPMVVGIKTEGAEPCSFQSGILGGVREARPGGLNRQIGRRPGTWTPAKTRQSSRTSDSYKSTNHDKRKRRKAARQ